MPPDGCPAAGAVNSEPLNAARRKKDLNTPAAGLAGNEGLKHPVHRPALLAESYVESAAAALPLGRLFRRANQSFEPDPG